MHVNKYIRHAPGSRISRMNAQILETTIAGRLPLNSKKQNNPLHDLQN